MAYLPSRRVIRGIAPWAGYVSGPFAFVTLKSYHVEPMDVYDMNDTAWENGV